MTPATKLAIISFVGLLSANLVTALSGENVINLNDVSPAQYGIAILSALAASVTAYVARGASPDSQGIFK